MATGKPRHPESPGFRRGLLGAALLEDCGTILPEQDVRNADRGNPRRFHRSAKWTKARRALATDSKKPRVETRGLRA